MGRPKEVVEGNTRGARGKLKNLVIQPATLRRYETAMKHFLEFLKWNSFTLPSGYEEVDRLASLCIEELWEEGDSRYLAQDILSGLQHFEPQLKRRLMQSWRLIKAWQKHEIPSRAPPLTPSTLFVLAGWLHQHVPEVALGVALGFFGLLRTGELLQIRHKDLICTHDFVVIHLGSTKMAVRNAGVESTSFSHETISIMLQAWKSVNTPDALLINMSSSAFRQWFARGLHATGLGSAYKPYSLRRGGATQVFLDTQSYSTVCQRGRWASERTCRVYIQDSVALLTEHSTQLTSKQREFHTLWTNIWRRLERPSKAGRNRGRGE